jgi:hypothetical protein
VTLFSAGRQKVTCRRTEDPAFFCGKAPRDFGAEVYRNSTGVSGSGKSAGKTARLPRQACPIMPLAANRLPM